MHMFRTLPLSRPTDGRRPVRGAVHTRPVPLGSPPAVLRAVGDQLLQTCAEAGNYEIAKDLLMKHDADPEFKDRSAWPSLLFRFLFRPAC